MTALLKRRHSIGLALLGAWLGGWLLVGYTDGLQAAGLKGDPPPNAGAFQKFVDQLADNAVWVIGTVVLLALVALGGLFFFGHSRAQDYAAKIAAGAGLIVLAPGIAA